MSEHFVIKNIRRSIKESQSDTGMHVGLPEIRIASDHAEVLLREINQLKRELEEARRVAEKYEDRYFNIKAELEEVNELSKQECREHALFAQSTGNRLAALEAELARYRNGVEVVTEVVQVCGGYPVLRSTPTIPETWLGQRVKVLILTEDSQ